MERRFGTLSIILIALVIHPTVASQLKKEQQNSSPK